jgi:hypothetical protein
MKTRQHYLRLVASNLGRDSIMVVSHAFSRLVVLHFGQLRFDQHA